MSPTKQNNMSACKPLGLRDVHLGVPAGGTGRQALAEGGLQLQKLHQQDDDQCCPNLRLHGALVGAYEGLDLQALLDALKNNSIYQRPL